MRRREFAAMLAAPPMASLGGGFLDLAHAEQSDFKPVPLKTLGAAKGLRVGSAIGATTLLNPRYRALMARECSTLVTENECKWRSVSPHPGDWHFGPADKIFAWGSEAGLLKRGHCLVWQPTKWLPHWVVQAHFGRGAAVAEKLLTERISGMTARYGQEVYSWDVVNEAIDPATGEYRETVFTQALGAVEQIDLCFRLARAGAPQAQLVYNDYMRWDVGSAKHRAGVLKLLHALKARGTPIDALGLQSHIGAWDAAGTGPSPQQEWRKFLDEVSGMGLQLLITEFDVNDRKLPGDVAQRDAGVASLARDYLDQTLSYDELRDFLFWGLTDDASWLQTWGEAPRADQLAMRPCPYDDSYQAKPLREAVASAIKAMTVRA